MNTLGRAYVTIYIGRESSLWLLIMIDISTPILKLDMTVFMVATPQKIKRMNKWTTHFY